MFKGFYDLSSAMLTQTRNLDVVGNNMSNTATVGYKADRYADTTFDEVMRSQIGNKQKNPQELGTTTSYITAFSGGFAIHGTTLGFWPGREWLFCHSDGCRTGIYP